MANKHCKKCQYWHNDGLYSCCYYIGKTGKMRGCTVEECTLYMDEKIIPKPTFRYSFPKGAKKSVEHNTPEPARIVYDRAEMLELYNSEYSDRQIAEKMGCSMTIVYNWRRRNKLPNIALRSYKQKLKDSNYIFAKRLKEIRTEKELSQGQLSQETSVSRCTVNRCERGERLPNEASLNKLARYFDVSTEWLLGKTDERGKYVESRGSE